MKPRTHHNRWQNLFYMYVALAKGNFSFRIKRTKNDDELEAFVALSNMLAEELQETFRHHGFINPRRTYIYLSKMDFYLSKELSILNFSKEVPELLQLGSSDLLNVPFCEILDTESLQVWEEIKPQINQELFKRFSLTLNFRNGRDLIIHSNCYISSLFSENEGPRFVVSSFIPVILDENSCKPDPTLSFTTGKENYRLPKIFSQQSDVRQAHKVRDYILQNLGKDFLDMKELTQIFFTNESKLKNDFKAVFGITPFQFIKKERLNLAKELVQNTSLPLKNISVTCGFNSYPHFSFAFKEEFKLSPQRLRNSLL